MRRYRMGLIQTAEQLRFSYQSIIEGAEYMNIDLRWIPPHVSRSNSSESDTDSNSEDDSNSPEEVDEQDDVSCEAALLLDTFDNHAMVLNNSIGEVTSANDLEETPPPVPPRDESISRPCKSLTFIIYL